MACRLRSSGHENRLDRSALRAESPCLIGIALYGAVRSGGVQPVADLTVSHGDPIVLEIIAVGVHIVDCGDGVESQ